MLYTARKKINIKGCAILNNINQEILIMINEVISAATEEHENNLNIPCNRCRNKQPNDYLNNTLCIL